MLMIMLTGLSGSGKTTLAESLFLKLKERNMAAVVIDGDQHRKTINRDLGFSAADRRENIQRLAKLADEKNRQGVISIVAAINPFEDLRNELAQKYGAKIIWVRCNLATLIARDTKGLYYKAMLPDNHPDKVWNLTGVNDPYEMPSRPDLIIDTNEVTVENATQQILTFVLSLIQN
jgi:adenylylsulfate kinase